MYYLHYITLLLTALLLSCNPKKCVNNSITIKNNSSTRLFFNMYSINDTTIGDYNPLHNGTDGLSNGETFLAGGRGLCWEEVLGSHNVQSIYFFDADSLTVIPWDTIRKTYRGVLVRKDFTLDTLTQNNWVITYP